MWLPEPNQNQTALMGRQRHPKVLQILIEARISRRTPNWDSPRSAAARAGDMESTRTLLGAGVDVNIKSQQS
jgi:hypothetical protein